MASPSTNKDPGAQNKVALTRIDRFKIRLISGVGYWAIRIVCSTLRWQVEGWENFTVIHASGKRVIGVFWHGRIFMSGYFWRNYGFVVMVSQNKDGDYVARLMPRLGYGVARGSSSRGGRRALLEMIRVLRQNGDVAFTIDGPRGPRYVAKPGAAYLGWKTGNGIMAFNISVKKKWVLKSWDHFQIPMPFTQALVIIAPPIYVKPGASEEEIRSAEEQIQRSLDDLRERGDRHWRAPSPVTGI